MKLSSSVVDRTKLSQNYFLKKEKTSQAEKPEEESVKLKIGKCLLPEGEAQPETVTLKKIPGKATEEESGEET